MTAFFTSFPVYHSVIFTAAILLW